MRSQFIGNSMVGICTLILPGISSKKVIAFLIAFLISKHTLVSFDRSSLHYDVPVGRLTKGLTYSLVLETTVFFCFLNAALQMTATHHISPHVVDKIFQGLYRH